MKHFLAALVVAVPTSLLSTSVMSAAGVVEATPYLPGQAPAGAQPGSPAAGSNDALVMLLDQFREMRAELETLRGLVEEQGYELRNLQRESMDRYTDLDSRISSLSVGGPATGVSGGVPSAPVDQNPVTPAPAQTSVTQEPPIPAQNSASPQSSAGSIAASVSTPSPVNASSVPVAPAAQASGQAAIDDPASVPVIPTLQPTMLSEQQQYQVALDSLLQEEQYQRSIDEFAQYLSLYPAGRFVTNAYYWQGQAYLNLAMLNEARDAFETIVTQYPDGRKVDDAMYSLGTVYDKLGNPERATQLLRQVQSRFPNTSAANLADIYLRSMN